ncbi:MAG TPA: carbohydrate kinase family protein [Anaerolineales bacterium]
MERSSPRYLFAGQLNREYVILPSGEPRLDVAGGNVLYAAVGLAVWEPQPPPGLIARVGEDYPREWLDDFTRHGLDIRGVRVLPNAVDVRTFYAYADHYTRLRDDPVAHFARLGLPFPKTLLGYRSPTTMLDSRIQLLATSLRQGDIPPDFLDASAAHLCPLDYLTHSVLPAVLRQAEFTTVTLDPSPGYMNPTYWGDLPALITGLTAFLPSEEEVRSLFQGRSSDLWEMAEALSAYGCEIIVIKRGERGQLLYDAASHTRWEVSPYAARFIDPTGAGDAFCGGFMVGYRRTFEPLQAVLHGNISASLVVEGPTPFYALDALPGLAQARLDALQQSVRRV